MKAGLAHAAPASMRLERWGRIYGPSGVLWYPVEDIWSVEVRTALKSPPTILSEGGREGKEVQKGY